MPAAPLAALLRAGGDAEALARSLAALVPAAVEGALGGAFVVLAPEAPAALRDLADRAGATALEAADWGAGAAAAAARARSPHLIVLDAGIAPEEGWWRALPDALAALPPGGALAAAPAPRPGAGARARAAAALAGALARLSRRPGPSQALVLARAAVTGDPWARRYGALRPAPFAARDRRRA